MHVCYTYYIVIITYLFYYLFIDWCHGVRTNNYCHPLLTQGAACCIPGIFWTHSRNSDTNFPQTPTSRPVAVRQNPLNIVESMRLENHAGCLLSKWLSDLQMLLFPRGPLVEFLGHLHSPACIFCQNSTVWGAQLLFARFEPTPKQTAQTSASHPQIGFFLQASHTILISESHVFQHLHLRIDVAIAPTTSCRGCCGDLSTPGIGRGCRGDTSAGDRLREKGWGVNSETPELWNSIGIVGGWYHKKVMICHWK